MMASKFIPMKRGHKTMSKDITLKDFYEWLDTYPDDVIKWEVTEEFEGVRYVRFIVREGEDD